MMSSVLWSNVSCADDDISSHHNQDVGMLQEVVKNGRMITVEWLEDNEMRTNLWKLPCITFEKSRSHKQFQY